MLPTCCSDGTNGELSDMYAALEGGGAGGGARGQEGGVREGKGAGGGRRNKGRGREVELVDEGV